jgi:hypothetical protein
VAAGPSAAFRTDLRDAHAALRTSVVPKTVAGRDRYFSTWTTYCESLGVDPFLRDVDDDLAVDYLLVYALRLRRGELSRSGKPIRRGQVEEAVRAVGTQLTQLGLRDPRKQGERLTPRLKALFKSFGNTDPAPDRAWPATLDILASLERLTDRSPFQTGVLDLAIIGFFFLCRPGEYAASSEPGRSSPFSLDDVTFRTADRVYHAATAPLNELSALDTALTAVSLRYTDQKNAVRNETITHFTSGHALYCPARAALRRVLHLRTHTDEPTTPLYTTFHRSRTTLITTAHVTARLREAAAAVQHQTGIPPTKIEAYSLRAGGATALLCAGVDEKLIRLLGRWHSDAMFRYLRTMALPTVQHAAPVMLQSGRYTFLNTPDDLPDQVSDETRRLAAPITPTATPSPPPTNNPP